MLDAMLAAERLLTCREACAYLHVSRATLYRLPIRRLTLGVRCVRWSLADLRLYVLERTA